MATLHKFDPKSRQPNPALSQGVVVSGAQRTLYVSGQVGARPDGSVGNGIAEQAVIAIGNLNEVLAEADMGTEDIVKLTIYLTDENDLGGFVQAAGGSLPQPPPATTLLIVKALAGPGLCIEIEAVAAK